MPGPLWQGSRAPATERGRRVRVCWLRGLQGSGSLAHSDQSITYAGVGALGEMALQVQEDPLCRQERTEWAPRPHPSNMAALWICVLETSGSLGGDRGDAGRDPWPKSSLFRGPPLPSPLGSSLASWCPGLAGGSGGLGGSGRLQRTLLPGPCQNTVTTNKTQKAAWEWQLTSLP